MWDIRPQNNKSAWIILILQLQLNWSLFQFETETEAPELSVRWNVIINPYLIYTTLNWVQEHSPSWPHEEILCLNWALIGPDYTLLERVQREETPAHLMVYQWRWSRHEWCVTSVIFISDLWFDLRLWSMHINAALHGSRRMNS